VGTRLEEGESDIYTSDSGLKSGTKKTGPSSMIGLATDWKTTYVS
jgi:hypothetical protein